VRREADRKPDRRRQLKKTKEKKRADKTVPNGREKGTKQ
jgi:hypothetical protein